MWVEKMADHLGISRKQIESLRHSSKPLSKFAERFLRHVKQLNSLGLDLSKEEIIDEAIGFTNGYSSTLSLKFSRSNSKNEKNLAKIRKKIDQLRDSGLSDKEVTKVIVNEALDAGVFINQALLGGLAYRFAFEEMGFSTEEARELTQEIKNQSFQSGSFLNTPRTTDAWTRDLKKLSEIGFTNRQIVQIVGLNAVGVKGEKTSLEKKRDKLRKAGFTEEEINRIPVSWMHRENKDAIYNTLFGAYMIGGTTVATILILDALQWWLITGNSLIW